VVINTTAYTGVYKAETESEHAHLLSHLALANIANICADIGSVLIHISSDYVFDGESLIFYKEDDETNPQGVYGATKLAGEIAVQESGCDYLIIRTAWLFSEFGNNCLKTMLRLGQERDLLSIVSDQFGSPTYAQDLARAISDILLKGLWDKKVFGVYHYSGGNPCSWFEFAKCIFLAAAARGIETPKMLTAIKLSDYITPAKRPMYAVI
jgi:dTDP-4-dehydrorhamnose reductase